MVAATQRVSLGQGSRLGVYRVVRLLGSGAMGAVYEAVHTLLNKRVAIKLMHADLSGRQDLNDRFLREGRAAVAIQHPHVVQISDVGFHEGLPYLVMDFLEGTDLRAALQQRGNYPVGEACDLLLPVVAAVAAAHDAGVIHRDLKPDNVFLVQPARRDRKGVVPKVVDFGISKLNDGGAKTATQTIMGSPAYMSPEQCNGRTGPESDQWALGIMIYELCTGQLPFEAESQMALMYRICMGEPQPTQSYGVTLPPALEEIMLRALRKNPAERFPSVRTLGAALLSLCSPTVAERHAHDFAAGEEVQRTPLNSEIAPLAEPAVAVPLVPAVPEPVGPLRATPVATTVVVPQLAEASAVPHPRDTLTPSSHETFSPGPRPRRRVAALAGAGVLLAVGTPLLAVRLWSRTTDPAIEAMKTGADAAVEPVTKPVAVSLEVPSPGDTASKPPVVEVLRKLPAPAVPGKPLEAKKKPSGKSTPAQAQVVPVKPAVARPEPSSAPPPPAKRAPLLTD